MKIKGLVAIVVLLCVTLACGIAQTDTKTVNVGYNTYDYRNVVGQMNFVVVGTTSMAQTNTVNLYNGTNVISAGVTCYDVLNKKIVNSNASTNPAVLGGAVSASVSRDRTNNTYEYRHYANRWTVSSTNLTSSANLADSATYIAQQ